MARIDPIDDFKRYPGDWKPVDETSAFVRCAHGTVLVQYATAGKTVVEALKPHWKKTHADIDPKVMPQFYAPVQSLALSYDQRLQKNANIQAFLQTIAIAEGGDYNLKYGGIKGKKDDPYSFSDFSTHPGAGYGGKITAAGMYQINKDTWSDMGKSLGLTDFSPNTQDLMAIEILRTTGADEPIVGGLIDNALSIASHRWSSLPQGKGLPNRYPGQPYMTYETFIATYQAKGGTVR